MVPCTCMFTAPVLFTQEQMNRGRATPYARAPAPDPALIAHVQHHGCRADAGKCRSTFCEL